MPKNVIVLSKGNHKESYGSLTELCSDYPNFSYYYLKSKKFPFEYKGFLFEKLKYNQGKNKVG